MSQISPARGLIWLNSFARPAGRGPFSEENVQETVRFPRP
jgi:hypothetical protein